MNTATVQIASIPEEIIIFEILIRLPVKTLCRFRTVSKLWFSIINSRPFIDSHFQHSKLKPEFLFGFYNEDATTQLQPPMFFSTNYPQTADKWDTYYPCCSISPRGLICFYDSLDDTVRIWNPSTGERIWVNPPPYELPITRCAFFLGFDPVGKKHKLLSSCNRECYVFTVGEKKKKWRKIISSNCTASSISTNQNHCSIDGMLYYLAQNDQNEFVLAAFDFGSENFLETIRLPEKFVQVGGLIRVYRGRIVLLRNSGLHTHEMSVLEDVQKQKWSPMRIIPPLPPFSSPMAMPFRVGVIDGEELLMFSSNVNANSEGFWLCFYNLEKSMWTETQCDFRAEELGRSASYEVRLYYYVDNLEPIKSSTTLSILEKKMEEKMMKKKKRKRTSISFFDGG